MDIADWSLKESVARKVFRRFGNPDIDLMATQASRKVPRFISRCRGDKETIVLDSMSSKVKWDEWELPYLFPPFSLIGRCLQKIREQEVRRIIVIIPWQPQALYLGTALSMSLEPPVRLDHRKDLVMDLSTGLVPARWRTMQLIACLLTGKPGGDGVDILSTMELKDLRSLHQV